MRTATFWYDGLTLDIPSVSIHDGLDANGLKPLQGNYSVVLQDGWGSPGVYDAWISQAGDVPGDANSLVLSTDISPEQWAGRFTVSLNATAVPMYLYSAGAADANGRTVDTYIGDVRAFSGETNVVLKLDKLVQDPSNPTGPHGLITLDAIQFSTIIVPEPSALVLLGVAILSLAGYRWRLRRARRH